MIAELYRALGTDVLDKPAVLRELAAVLDRGDATRRHRRETGRARHRQRDPTATTKMETAVRRYEIKFRRVRMVRQKPAHALSPVLDRHHDPQTIFIDATRALQSNRRTGSLLRRQRSRRPAPSSKNCTVRRSPRVRDRHARSQWCRARPRTSPRSRKPWISSLVSILGPMSASAMIFNRALQVEFDHNYAVTIPNLVASASGVSFTAQGASNRREAVQLRGNDT